MLFHWFWCHTPTFLACLLRCACSLCFPFSRHSLLYECFFFLHPLPLRSKDMKSVKYNILECQLLHLHLWARLRFLLAWWLRCNRSRWRWQSRWWLGRWLDSKELGQRRRKLPIRQNLNKWPPFRPRLGGRGLWINPCSTLIIPMDLQKSHRMWRHKLQCNFCKGFLYCLGDNSFGHMGWFLRLSFFLEAFCLPQFGIGFGRRFRKRSSVPKNHIRFISECTLHMLWK